MMRLLPILLAVALPACSLFTSPDPAPAAQAVAGMAAVHEAQGNAFRAFAEAAVFDDDPVEDARKRGLVLAAIEKDAVAFAALRGSVERWLAEVGELTVEDLVKLGRDLYEQWKKIQEDGDG